MLRVVGVFDRLDIVLDLKDCHCHSRRLSMSVGYREYSSPAVNGVGVPVLGSGAA